MSDHAGDLEAAGVGTNIDGGESWHTGTETSAVRKRVSGQQYTSGRLEEMKVAGCGAGGKRMRRASRSNQRSALDLDHREFVHKKSESSTEGRIGRNPGN